MVQLSWKNWQIFARRQEQAVKTKKIFTHKKFCLFYYTSEKYDISKLIINEAFKQDEVSKLLNEGKKRKELNHINISDCNSSISNEFKISTESNMAVANLITKKKEKQEKEASLLNIINPNISKEDISDKDNNSIEENNFNNSDNQNNNDVINLSKRQSKEIIDARILNQKFQSCLDGNIEEKLDFLEILSKKQEIRTDIFSKIKNQKLIIL